jgi:hypothetical protein
MSASLSCSFGLSGLSGFWLNETNQMNQINQIKKTNQINQMAQIDQACLRHAGHRCSTMPKWFFRNLLSFCPESPHVYSSTCPRV